VTYGWVEDTLCVVGVAVVATFGNWLESIGFAVEVNGVLYTIT